jgi:hypothetical protein
MFSWDHSALAALALFDQLGSKRTYQRDGFEDKIKIILGAERGQQGHLRKISRRISFFRSASWVRRRRWRK